MTTTTAYTPNLTDTPKVGDIWISTWGYEAVNADWYVVTKVTPKMIGLAIIEAEETGNWEDGTSLPKLPVVIESKVTTTMHKVKDTSYGIRVKVREFASARPWEGSAVHIWNHH